jgi:hypothetical protein
MAPQKRFKHRPRMRTAVRATPHPSGGNGYAYSHDFRQFNLFAVQAGRENDPLMEQARQLRLVPSTRTNGLYYPPSSLKAKFCVKGTKLLYEYCAR